MAQPSNGCNYFSCRDAYRAAINGDTEILLKFCSQHPMARINASGDTIFHILALNYHAKVVDELLLKLPLHDLLTMTNCVGDTALHKAARVDCVGIADLMLQKEANLITAYNLLGETPIFGAAACGQVKMLRFLSLKPNCENGLRRNDGTTILHAAVKGEFYGIPVKASIPIKEDSENPRGMVHLHCIPWLRKVLDAKQKHIDALEVVKQLVAIQSRYSMVNYYINHGEDSHHCLASGLQWNKYEILSGENSNIDPLLQATKYGTIEIVKVILEEFPDAIEVLDKTGKNMLHLVAEHRQDKIFQFLNSKKIPITQMLVEVDKEGNTPLHLAAKYGFYQQRHVLSVLHQMPWEVFWFKLVRHFSPPQTHHLQNAEGQTPKELFDKTHRGLLQQSEKWVKDYTGATMIMSILIASFLFTAALTVPGGFDQNSGLPVLLHHKYFNSYFDLVSLSLLLSCSTLAVAIYARSSRFQQEDFYISLPLKFFLNGSFLFFCYIFTCLTYVETRRLESLTPLQNISGNTEMIIAFFLAILVHIDVTLPLYCYLIQVLLQSLS